MVRTFFLVFFLTAAVLAPATAQTVSGTAGVYDDGFAGKKTSSGDPYDPKAFTAALDDLRFGIRMAVTNLANGRTVTVRLNDDGPKKGHLVDLSKAAADFLGFTGTTQVRIRLLQADEKDVTIVPAATPTPRPFVPTPPAATYFQLGSFRTEANARYLAKSLAAAGYDPKIRHQGQFFRVYIEVAETDGPAVASKLTSEGRKGFLQLFKEPEGTLLGVSTE